MSFYFIQQYPKYYYISTTPATSWKLTRRAEISRNTSALSRRLPYWSRLDGFNRTIFPKQHLIQMMLVRIKLIGCFMTTSPPLNTTYRGCKHWKDRSLNYKHAITIRKLRKNIPKKQMGLFLLIPFKWSWYNVKIQCMNPCWFAQRC